MTVIRHNSGFSMATTDKLCATLRYQSAPTVLGLPEGSGVKNESGNKILTSSIVVGHYFNNPLVTGYVREKHPPRRLLEGYEKLAKRQNRKRSKAMGRLKAGGTWTVGPVSNDGLRDLRSKAMAPTRQPSAIIITAPPESEAVFLAPVIQPTMSRVDPASSAIPTNTMAPIPSDGKADNISDRKHHGIIGYNIGQTLQEVQRMFPPRIQEWIEQIVEGHTSVKYINRKYWYIYFNSEAALQNVLRNAPQRWTSREGRRENGPKITVMKDHRSPAGSDSDSDSEDLCLARQRGQTPTRAKQLMSQGSLDRAAQAKSIVSSAPVTSLEHLASLVAQTSVEIDGNPSDLSLLNSVVEQGHIDTRHETQQALLSNINCVLNTTQHDAVSNEIPSIVRVTENSHEQYSSAVSNDSSQADKPMSPASHTIAPPELWASPRLSPAPSISSAPDSGTTVAETTSLLSSDSSFASTAPLINKWGSRPQGRPGRGESHARTTATTIITPTPASTSTKKAQPQATLARPSSVVIHAPPGSSSRLGTAMARPWPQLNINGTKERSDVKNSVARDTAKQPSQSREGTRPGTPIITCATGKSNSPVIGSEIAPVATAIKPTIVEAVNPELVPPEPVTPVQIALMTNASILPQTATITTKAMTKTPIPVIPTTTLEVPIIVCTAATPPDLLDLNEDSLPISFHRESIFVLPSSADSLGGERISTIGDWKTDLAGLEWVTEEVVGGEIISKEQNEIQDSDVEAVIKIMGDLRVGAELMDGVPAAQGNNAIMAEIRGDFAKQDVAFTTPTTTDFKAKPRVGDYTSEMMNLLLSEDKIIIKQEPDTGNIDMSTITIYEPDAASTLDAAIKTEVSEIPTSANPDNDDEWEDEDKTREFAKKRARGHRSGQKHSSKRKDMEQDLVSTHLKFLRKAGGLREILEELRRLEEE